MLHKCYNMQVLRLNVKLKTERTRENNTIIHMKIRFWYKEELLGHEKQNKQRYYPSDKKDYILDQKHDRYQYKKLSTQLNPWELDTYEPNRYQPSTKLLGNISLISNLYWELY